MSKRIYFCFISATINEMEFNSENQIDTKLTRIARKLYVATHCSIPFNLPLYGFVEHPVYSYTYIVITYLLNFSFFLQPDTVPQGSVDMSKVLEVTGAEQITGHPHSLALTGPDRVTFVKAASREDARWWAELLAVFPRRHKRNATFPGGRASPSLPQLGRSASPQPPRPRHLSYIGPSTRGTFASTFREEKHRESKRFDTSEISANWLIEKPPPKAGIF